MCVCLCICVCMSKTCTHIHQNIAKFFLKHIIYSLGGGYLWPIKKNHYYYLYKFDGEKNIYIKSKKKCKIQNIVWAIINRFHKCLWQNSIEQAKKENIKPKITILYNCFICEISTRNSTKHTSQWGSRYMVYQPARNSSLRKIWGGPWLECFLSVQAGIIWD